MLPDPYPRALRSLVRRAVRLTGRRLSDAAPTLGGLAVPWMRALAGGREPEAYFLDPQAFPMLLLPWWLETTIRGEPDRGFHGDVVYSTVNGYYLVRMIDDLMDAERTPPAGLLPALMLFHTEFEQTYFRHFPHGHPFWAECEAATLASAELASLDAGRAEVDLEHFLGVSARKTAGARIPIAAVCHRYGRPDLIAPWSALLERFGRWHQMLNDLRGWRRDLDAGRGTYLLTTARAMVGPGGSVDDWVLGAGLAWAAAELDRWMAEAIERAQGLASPPLAVYLEQRRAALGAELGTLAAGRATLERLAASLR